MGGHNPDQDLVAKATELGRVYEQRYFGCSQATVAALLETFGLDLPQVLRASTGFAGGLVRRGHICGALTGALMVLGALTGRDDLEMTEQYRRGMDYAEQLYTRFEDRFKTISCHGLQERNYGRSFDLQDPEDREELHELIRRRDQGCHRVTAEAAGLAAEIILEIFQQPGPRPRMLALCRHRS